MIWVLRSGSAILESASLKNEFCVDLKSFRYGNASSEPQNVTASYCLFLVGWLVVEGRKEKARAGEHLHAIG